MGEFASYGGNGLLGGAVFASLYALLQWLGKRSERRAEAARTAVDGYESLTDRQLAYLDRIEKANGDLAQKVAELTAEIARLRTLLAAHGITDPGRDT